MAQSIPWVMGSIIWFSTAWTRILIEIQRDQPLRLSLEYITISTLPGGQKPSWLPPSGLREVSNVEEVSMMLFLESGKIALLITTSCSCREHKFDLQHFNGSSLPETPVPWGLMPFACLHWYYIHIMHRHRCRQNTHTY